MFLTKHKNGVTKSQYLAFKDEKNITIPTYDNYFYDNKDAAILRASRTKALETIKGDARIIDTDR